MPGGLVGAKMPGELLDQLPRYLSFSQKWLFLFYQICMNCMRFYLFLFVLFEPFLTLSAFTSQHLSQTNVFEEWTSQNQSKTIVFDDRISQHLKKTNVLEEGTSGELARHLCFSVNISFY